MSDLRLQLRLLSAGLTGLLPACLEGLKEPEVRIPLLLLTCFSEVPEPVLLKVKPGLLIALALLCHLRFVSSTVGAGG